MSVLLAQLEDASIGDRRGTSGDTKGGGSRRKCGESSYSESSGESLHKTGNEIHALNYKTSSKIALGWIIIHKS